MPVQITMDDRLFRELRAKIGAMKDAHVKIGVLESKGGGDTAEDGKTTLAEIAAIHEFGAPRANIPARSFLRQTFQDPDGRQALSGFLTRIGRAVVAERIEVGQALEQLGAWAVAQVKKRIKSNIPPPLQPATVKSKGSSTALIDTGQLVNAITWEVKK